MPQPRERQLQHGKDRQDQAPNKQDDQARRHAQDAPESAKRPNPDRYPDQGKQEQKPSEGLYPEQDPSRKAEQPDAVEGAESGRPDRRDDRDLN